MITTSLYIIGFTLGYFIRKDQFKVKSNCDYSEGADSEDDALLTKGKIYTVLAAKKKDYCIIDNNGEIDVYAQDYFTRI